MHASDKRKATPDPLRTNVSSTSVDEEINVDDDDKSELNEGSDKLELLLLLDLAPWMSKGRCKKQNLSKISNKCKRPKRLIIITYLLFHSQQELVHGRIKAFSACRERNRRHQTVIQMVCRQNTHTIAKCALIAIRHPGGRTTRRVLEQREDLFET